MYCTVLYCTVLYCTVPGLHELDVLQPQVEADILPPLVVEAEHLDEEGKLVRVEGVVLVPLADHALVDLHLMMIMIMMIINYDDDHHQALVDLHLGLLMAAVWELELVVLCDGAVLAVGHRPVQVLDRHNGKYLK